MEKKIYTEPLINRLSLNLEGAILLASTESFTEKQGQYDEFPDEMP